MLPKKAVAQVAMAAISAAGGLLAAVALGSEGHGAAAQPSRPVFRADADLAAPRALMARARAEVAVAVAEAGQPPCGDVHVTVKATVDGRSWAWPGECRILLDAALVDTGSDSFRYVVRHEVAHLHAGTDHFAPGFRALLGRLTGSLGYDLAYAPGAEYPTLVGRPR